MHAMGRGLLSLYAGFETCFDPSTRRCWDPLAKSTSRIQMLSEFDSSYMVNAPQVVGKGRQRCWVYRIRHLPLLVRPDKATPTQKRQP